MENNAFINNDFSGVDGRSAGGGLGTIVGEKTSGTFVGNTMAYNGASAGYRAGSELAAVRDDAGLLGGAARTADGLAGLDNVHALADFAEDGVLPVQPGGHNGGDEELGPVGVGAGV